MKLKSLLPVFLFFPIVSFAQFPSKSVAVQSFKANPDKTNTTPIVDVELNGIPASSVPFDRQFILNIKSTKKYHIDSNINIRLYYRRYFQKNKSFLQSGYKLTKPQPLFYTVPEKTTTGEISHHNNHFMVPQLKPRRLYEFILTEEYDGRYHSEYITLFEKYKALTDALQQKKSISTPLAEIKQANKILNKSKTDGKDPLEIRFLKYGDKDLEYFKKKNELFRLYVDSIYGNHKKFVEGMAGDVARKNKIQKLQSSLISYQSSLDSLITRKEQIKNDSIYVDYVKKLIEKHGDINIIKRLNSTYLQRGVKINEPNDSLRVLRILSLQNQEAIKNTKKQITKQKNDIKELQDRQNSFFSENRCFDIGYRISSTTEIYDFKTSNGMSVAPDFGLIYYRGSSGQPFGGVSPYVGIHINMRPYDQNIPLGLIDDVRLLGLENPFNRRKGTYIKNIWQRTTFNAGLILTNISEDGERESMTIANQQVTPMVGIGFKATRAVRVIGGAIFYKNINDGLFYNTTNTSIGWYSGVAIDINTETITQAINGLFKFP